MAEARIKLSNAQEALVYLGTLSDKGYGALDRETKRVIFEIIRGNKKFEVYTDKDLLKKDFFVIQGLLREVYKDEIAATTPEKGVVEEGTKSAEQTARVAKEARKTAVREVERIKQAAEEVRAKTEAADEDERLKAAALKQRERVREVLGHKKVLHIEPETKPAVVTFSEPEAQNLDALVTEIQKNPDRAVGLIAQRIAKTGGVSPELAEAISVPAAADFVQRVRNFEGRLPETKEERLAQLVSVRPAANLPQALAFYATQTPTDIPEAAEVALTFANLENMRAQAVTALYGDKVARVFYGSDEEQKYKVVDQPTPNSISIDMPKFGDLVRNFIGEKRIRVEQLTSGTAKVEQFIQSDVKAFMTNLPQPSFGKFYEFVSGLSDLIFKSPISSLAPEALGGIEAYSLVNPTLFSYQSAASLLGHDVAFLAQMQGMNLEFMAQSSALQVGVRLGPQGLSLFAGSAQAVTAGAGATATTAAGEAAVAGTTAATIGGTAAVTAGEVAGTSVLATFINPIIGAVVAIGGLILTLIGPKLLKWIKEHLEDLSIGLLGIGAGGLLVGSAPLAVLGLGGGLLLGAGAGLTVGAGLALALLRLRQLFTGAILPGIAGPIIGFLIGFPVLVTLILFIINSGAYVVPPGPGAIIRCTTPEITSGTEILNPGGVSRIMPVGDSITVGQPGTTGETSPGGYRGPLKELLTNAGYDTDFVGDFTSPYEPMPSDDEHQAEGGQDTAWVLRGIEDWVGRHSPDIVLLHIGTNHLESIGIDQNIENLREIVARINEYSEANRPDNPIKILLATIIRLGPDHPSVDSYVEYNTRIKELVGLTNVMIVGNMENAVSLDQLPDGVHPDPSGYENMAGVWFGVLTGEATGSTGACSVGVVASGTCPLVGGGPISTSSYNPVTETGHGSNTYWSIVGGTSCRFNIPIPGMYPDGCQGPSPDTPGYNSGNVCAQAPGIPRCPFYGYATDIGSAAGREVALPYLCDPGAASCPALSWRFENGFWNCGATSNPLSEPPGCASPNGQGLIFSASGNGHSWRIYLNHVTKAPHIQIGETYASGTIVATIADLAGNSHLHIELNIDGEPKKPDFLCSGGSSTLPGGNIREAEINGWLVEADINNTNLMSSAPSEYGQTTCNWAGPKDLIAVNANFFDALSAPIGPAAYRGQFTNYLDSAQAERYTLSSFMVEGGRGRILSSYGISDDQLRRAQLAVTGVTYETVRDESRPRTALGIGGNKLYLLVARAATPNQVRDALETAGATQSFMLDGGSSTTLCNRSDLIYSGRAGGGAAPVSVSLGVKSGIIYELVNR